MLIPKRDKNEGKLTGGAREENRDHGLPRVLLKGCKASHELSPTVKVMIEHVQPRSVTGQ